MTKLEDVEPEVRWRAIISAVMNRLPRPELGGDPAYTQRVLEAHVADEVRKLWALGVLPCPVRKAWIAGLRVSCVGQNQSVGAGWVVGPAKPREHRARYTVVSARRDPNWS